MIAKCYSAAVCGVEARSVEIEVSTILKTSSFAIVGLPDAAVKEAKDRIPAAIRNSGFEIKQEYDVTVNLAPADLRKEGPLFDLPIAIAFLASIGRIGNENIDEYAFAGELSLFGEVRPVRGVLPIVMEMRRIGRRTVLVSADNVEEASMVEGIDVIGVSTLRQAVEFLNGRLSIEPARNDISDLLANSMTQFREDFSDVKGQESAVEAITIAVAGGHNILMIGSPGSGKTMLSRRIPTILPPLSVEEALEVSRIHSVAGLAKSRVKIALSRPFRAPHHTVSSIGLLGGGSHPVPGEVSLAHRGVLFLDEFAEFPRHSLEVMRQPLEDGHVEVSRASAACDFPSRFMLVAAMNPCPCGYYNDRARRCRCTMSQILKYQNRISGPLLDRIDLHIEVPSVDVKNLPLMKSSVSSSVLRERVLAARVMQRERYRGLSSSSMTNADVRGRDLPDACKLTRPMLEDLSRLISKLDLSARAYDKILRVARTIADLAGSDGVSFDDLLAASLYRKLDSRGENSFWA
jgi:magnesium chelatase family protein